MFRVARRVLGQGRVLLPVVTFAVVAGCAKPSTLVLEPYALADGTMYQDVITIAADERGTAPVVTHTKTFELRTGYKGGPKSTAPVAAASGSAPGLVSTVTGAAISSGIPAATSAAIARSGWNRARVNNSTTVSNTNSGGSGEAAPINITNNNTNSNINTNTNENDNSSSNDAINSNILNGS